MTIKIGMRVQYSISDMNDIHEGTIKNIERCEFGEKYGEAVSSAELASNDCEYTIVFDNNKWCYGEQIISIIK